MKKKYFPPARLTWLQNTGLGQSSILFGATTLAMGLNFISGIITANELGAERYGDMKFIQVLWSLFTLLFSFGYFHSGSRLLVIEKDSEKIREITGAILFIALMIGMGLGVFTALLAVPLDVFFTTNVSGELIQLAPWMFVLPMSAALILVLQGINHIHLLSILSILPVLLYLTFIFILSYLNKLTPVNVLLSNQIASLLIILFIVHWLRPSLKSLKTWWRLIRLQNKEYGGPVYFGSLANVASAYINRLAISYWVDNTSIGFYSLANSLTEPLKLEVISKMVD